MEEWMIGCWSNASVSSSGNMLTEPYGADVMKLSSLRVVRHAKWRWYSFLYHKSTSKFSEQAWTVKQYCHLEIMRKLHEAINQASEIWLDAWNLYYINALLMTCSLSRVLGQQISTEIGMTTVTIFNTMWPLAVPKNWRPLWRVRDFQTMSTFRDIYMTTIMKSITEGFQKCFEQWKKCLHMCAVAWQDHLKGDSD